MTQQGGTEPSAENSETATERRQDSRLPYSGLAVAAMVTAACSILCPPLGFVGVALGALAYYDLRRRTTTHRGASLAMIGVVIGGLTSGLTLGVGLWMWQRASRDEFHESTSKGRISTPRLPLVAEREVVPTTAALEPKEDTREVRAGSLVIVDLGPRIRSLSDALDEQNAEARASGQRLLVWLVVPDCEPCDRVALSLTNERLQRALGRTRLVRLDAVKFAVELSRMNLPLDAFPGFALIGESGAVVDFIHGGEWDADIPENVAPVLESFVRGTYLDRRHPWRGGPHTDETPI